MFGTLWGEGQVFTFYNTIGGEIVYFVSIFCLLVLQEFRRWTFETECVSCRATVTMHNVTPTKTRIIQGFFSDGIMRHLDIPAKLNHD